MIVSKCWKPYLIWNLTALKKFISWSSTVFSLRTWGSSGSLCKIFKCLFDGLWGVCKLVCFLCGKSCQVMEGSEWAVKTVVFSHRKPCCPSLKTWSSVLPGTNQKLAEYNRSCLAWDPWPDYHTGLSCMFTHKDMSSLWGRCFLQSECWREWREKQNEVY